MNLHRLKRKIQMMLYKPKRPGARGFSPSFKAGASWLEEVEQALEMMVQKSRSKRR